MIIEIHKELDARRLAEWREFLHRSPHQHPRQDPVFGALERANGHTPLYALGRESEDGPICALGVFSLRPARIMPGRYGSATSMSGPVCNDIDTAVTFLSKLANHSAFARVGAMRITPYWLGDKATEMAQALEAAGWIRAEVEPFRHTGLIDLTPSEAELRAGFSRSARRKIKAVEQQDITIREVYDHAEATVFFDRLDHFILAHHGLTRISSAEREALIGTVCRDPARGVLMGAFDKDNFLGGFLIYRSTRTVHAARYVADLDNAKLRVAPSLWLAGMLWAKAQGCTVMDVEGYEDVSDKNHPKFNIYEYKRQLGPAYVQRTPEYMMPLNKAVHAVEELPQKARQFAKSLGLSGRGE